MPKVLPKGITVRQVLPTDIPSLADLLVSAPDDGSLYQFPHMTGHPKEMYNLHVGWLCPTLSKPTTLIRVAVVSGEEDRVVGYSSWTRREANEDSDSEMVRRELAQTTWSDSLSTFLSELASRNKAEIVPPSKALAPNKTHQQAVYRTRKQAPISPSETVACYELGGLAVHADYQSRGIGSLLVQWGLDRAAEEGVPVFVTGEARGVDFYEHALGFQRLVGSEYWLDKDGCDVSREEVLSGSRAWEKDEGGLSGAEMVWLPEGVVLTVKGHRYKG